MKFREWNLTILVRPAACIGRSSFTHGCILMEAAGITISLWNDPEQMQDGG